MLRSSRFSLGSVCWALSSRVARPIKRTLPGGALSCVAHYTPCRQDLVPSEWSDRCGVPTPRDDQGLARATRNQLPRTVGVSVADPDPDRPTHPGALRANITGDWMGSRTAAGVDSHLHGHLCEIRAHSVRWKALSDFCAGRPGAMDLCVIGGERGQRAAE